MEQLLCRLVKDQVTPTFFVWENGLWGWSTPVITYLYFDPMDSFLRVHIRPALKTPRGNGP